MKERAYEGPPTCNSVRGRSDLVVSTAHGWNLGYQQVKRAESRKAAAGSRRAGSSLIISKSGECAESDPDEVLSNLYVNYKTTFNWHINPSVRDHQQGYDSWRPLSTRVQQLQSTLTLLLASAQFNFIPTIFTTYSNQYCLWVLYWR